MRKYQNYADYPMTDGGNEGGIGGNGAAAATERGDATADDRTVFVRRAPLL